jgi:hypothetical protein
LEPGSISTDWITIAAHGTWKVRRKCGENAEKVRIVRDVFFKRNWSGESRVMKNQFRLLATCIVYSYALCIFITNHECTGWYSMGFSWWASDTRFFPVLSRRDKLIFF